jgi:hypothetical protein
MHAVTATAATLHARDHATCMMLHAMLLLFKLLYAFTATSSDERSRLSWQVAQAPLINGKYFP